MNGSNTSSLPTSSFPPHPIKCQVNPLQTPQKDLRLCCQLMLFQTAGQRKITRQPEPQKICTHTYSLTCLQTRAVKIWVPASHFKRHEVKVFQECILFISTPHSVWNLATMMKKKAQKEVVARGILKVNRKRDGFHYTHLKNIGRIFPVFPDNSLKQLTILSIQNR